MLDAMRKRASSWVVRVLLGLLIVSFAVWGIGDIFLGTGGGNVVAEVGDLEVTTSDLDRELDSQIRRLSAQFGTNLDRRQALALGLLNQSLQSRIAQRLVDMHGVDLGIGVADAAIRTVITEDPLFRGETGFDRQRMELVLRSQGLNEDSLIEEVRREIRRNLVVQAVSDLAQTPEVIAARIEAHRNETRNATMLRVEAEAMNVDEPDDATLEVFLEENKARYEAPEYRSGVIALLAPEDITSEIEITDAELREVYEARLDAYTTPERRRVGQLLASDQAVIDAAKKAVEEGATLAETAESMADDGVGYTAIGPVARNDLPTALSDAIFSVADSESLAGPVKSAFGWHLFRLIEMEEEKVTPFEDVQDALRDELALERARLELPDLANALDDEIAAGATLETATTQLGLDLIEVDGIDRSGLDREGNAVDVPGLTGEVLAAIFGAELDETSLLEETQRGYMMYRVDAVEAPRDRTLDEVRDRLTEAWTVNARQEAARTEATALLERTAGGATLEALAEEGGDAVTLVTATSLRRGGSGALDGLNRAAVAAIFALEKGGDLGTEPIDVGGGSALLRLDEVIEAEPPESLDTLRQQIAGDVRGDLLNQYEQALRGKYSIQVNEEALQALALALDPEAADPQ